MSAQENHPLFIISPTGKSGTNFLARSLVTLGLCEPPSKEVLKTEDHLLFHSQLLEQYVKRTSQIWNRWKKDEALIKARSNELLRNIGDGLLQFLGTPNDAGKRLVVKTPTARNLDCFPDLFPTAKLILLVRDGRDVAESQVQASYRSCYEDAFANWAKSARQILDFMSGPAREAEGSLWILVRYEDLVTNLEQTVHDIATFLGVDPASLEAAKVLKLPVFGSSYLERRGDAGFKWRVAEKPRDFKFIGRWSHWDQERHELFRQTAGRELGDLGYDPDKIP